MWVQQPVGNDKRGFGIALDEMWGRLLRNFRSQHVYTGRGRVAEQYRIG